MRLFGPFIGQLSPIHHCLLVYSGLTVFQNFYLKPLFSDKIRTQSKIVLVGHDEVISDDCQVAEFFSSYFVTVAETLGIAENLDHIR